MHNEDVLRTALERDLTKMVKGSNLAYVPINTYNREVKESGNAAMCVPENWQLHGVMRSFGDIIALVVTNTTTDRREVWHKSQGLCATNKAKHINLLRVRGYNTDNPSTPVEKFEIDTYHCKFTCNVDGELKRYITRAHSHSMLNTLRRARDFASCMESGTSTYFDWRFGNLHKAYEIARDTALVNIGESTIHTDATDPTLSEYRSRFDRVGRLLERTMGMEEEELRPLWAAYYLMERDLT